MKKWCIYILEVRGGNYYTGITNDLDRRMKAHASGKGSKYVRANLPFKIVYIEIAINKSAALKREAQIKRMTKIKKKEIVDNAKNNIV